MLRRVAVQSVTLSCADLDGAQEVRKPMANRQLNPLRESGKPLFFKVQDAANIGVEPPAIRMGEAVRLCVRSLSVMQKEALVMSARTGAAT
jgi:hypothetical protein